MPYTTLIRPEELARYLADPNWAVVDCRFSLNDTERGRREYLVSHVAGAVYAHIDEDLSGPVLPGVTGRHPLPDPQLLARRLSDWGVDAGVQVVAYDDSGGSMAARLWWLLRWLGHDAVAVLDGGWQSWLRAGYATTRGAESRPPREFLPRPRSEMIAEAEEVLRLSSDPAHRVVDSRAADRYRGENETIDPVAGHIPGAANLPYAGNLDPAGRFLAPEQLRQRIEAALGGVPAGQAIFYCGSGVTAAHNLLAVEHAGLGPARLYPGSWSEWITRPAYPVATGEEGSWTGTQAAEGEDKAHHGGTEARRTERK